MQHHTPTPAVEPSALGEILLTIASLLMSNGASSNRIRLTVTRISDRFGYHTSMMITNMAITLVITDDHGNNLYQSLRRNAPHVVNFETVSGISRMSWRAAEEAWTLDQITDELERIKQLPHYPRWLVLGAVGLAGAAFSRLFGGDALAMATTFGATVAGLFVRQEAVKHKFNFYLCIFFAAFTAAFLAGLVKTLLPDSSLEHAFAASVLFLIPGVPLLNSFVDMMDGNLLNGIVRGVNTLIISFAIALGVLSTLGILGLW